MGIISISQAQLLEAVRNDLSVYAAPINGMVSMADSPWQAIELLGTTGSYWRAVLNLGNDENANESINHQATVLKTMLHVTLVGYKGTDWHNYLALTQQRYSAAIPPLLTLRDDLRAYVLAMRFEQTPDTQLDVVHRGQMFYAGCAPVSAPAGVPLSAWRLSFVLRHGAAITQETHIVKLQP